MVSGLKVLVDDESSVVDETIIVNRLENIVVDISVSASDQNAALDFQFILFAFLLLFLVSTALTIHLRSLILLHQATVLVLGIIRMLRLRLFINVKLLLFILLIWDIKSLDYDAFQIAIMVVGYWLRFLM
jgi:hypothetical protein